MRRLRIAHFSDTHLGYRALAKADPETGRNQRLLDIERTFREVIDNILTRDVDLVIHAGDVFHHTRPTWPTTRLFVEQMRRFEDAGIPVVVIGGNHDTPRLRTSGSVFSLLEFVLPKVSFVCEYEQKTIFFPELDLAILAVPHGKLADPIGPSAFPEPGMRNVLVTHGLVSNLELRSQHREPGEEEIADHLLAEEFDYIALGHYHVHQKVRHNAWYSSSTERMGFGDEDVTPGYALVELGNIGAPAEVVHVPVDARPMLTLPYVDGEARSAREIADLVLKRVADHADPAANLRIEIRNALRPVRREAESIIRREVGDTCWWLQVFTRGDLLASQTEGLTASTSTDLHVLFDEFVTGRGYDSTFEEIFRPRGHKALDDAMRAAESMAPDEGAS